MVGHDHLSCALSAIVLCFYPTNGMQGGLGLCGGVAVTHC